MSTEPEPTWMNAICHTGSECPANGIPNRVPCYPNSDPPTWRVICVPCGNAVADLTPAP
jgi:hypothetical protein